MKTKQIIGAVIIIIALLNATAFSFADGTLATYIYTNYKTNSGTSAVGLGLKVDVDYYKGADYTNGVTARYYYGGDVEGQSYAYYVNKLPGFNSYLKKLTIQTGRGVLANAFSSASNPVPMLEEINVTTSSNFEICSKAFQNATSLKTIQGLFNTTRSGLTIGTYAFAGCRNLRTPIVSTKGLSPQSYAFQGCTSIPSVDISSTDGNITIGSQAFAGCTGIESLSLKLNHSASSTTAMNLNISTKAFDGCSGLNSITFGDGTGSGVFNYATTTIGEEAFSNCTGLSQLHFNSGSKYVVGNNAFNGCTNLSKLIFSGNNLGSWGSNVFAGSKINSLSLSGNQDFSTLSSVLSGSGYKTTLSSVSFNGTEVPSNVFSNCKNLSTFTINNRVTAIRENAFKGDSSLTEITIPSSVNEIEAGAFYGCTNLKTIRIDQGVSVDENAFTNCPNIEEVIVTGESYSNTNLLNAFDDAVTSVTIGADVQNISSDVFDGYNLEIIKVEDDNEAFTSIDGVLYSKSEKTLIRYPEAKTNTRYYLPESVSSVSNKAFYGTDKLSKLVILDNATVIGEDAFDLCDATFYIIKGTPIDLYLADKDKDIVYLYEPQERTEGDTFVFTQEVIPISINEPVELLDYLAAKDYLDIDNIDISISDHSKALYGEGLIVGLSPGESSITATFNGKTIEGIIRVTSDDITAPQALSFDESEVNAVKGEYVFNQVNLGEGNYSTEGINWSSSDESVAIVDSKGLVHCKSIGETEITASVSEGISASYHISVNNPLEKIITFESEREYSVDLGRTTQIKYYLYPSDNNETADTVFTSADETIATIDEEGIVTGINAGNTEITIAKGNVQTAIIVSVVAKPLTSLSLNKSEITLADGESELLNVIYEPEDTTDSTAISWTSSDESVATVDSQGTVAFVECGNATITAHMGNLEASCAVSCIRPLTGITLDKSTLQLSNKESEQLHVSFEPENTSDEKNITWSSSNTDVVEVSDQGLVTSVGAGAATVTATVGAFSAECTVSCPEVPLTNIAISDALINLEKGASKQLTIAYEPNNTTEQRDVIWTTGNNNVAEVDEDGNVTATGAGVTRVTATVGECSAFCTVVCQKSILKMWN